MSSAKIAKLQSIAAGGKNPYVEPESDCESDEDEKEVKSKEMEYKTGELEIRALGEREHALHRPDMYIGSVKRIKSSGRIWIMNGDRFRCREVHFTEGLLRVFMEAVSNAIDNIWRSTQFKTPCKMIKVSIDRASGVLSVWNDGLAISCGKYKDAVSGKLTENYKPEVIFGQFRSGTNYDDTENRKTVGRNGFGIKGTNIFAKWFRIKLFNRKEGLIYEQKWTNNMAERQPAIIDQNKKHFPTGDGEDGCTLVEWEPDYKRFDSPSGIDEDMLAVMEKAVYDYALMAALSGVQTFYNGSLIPIHDFKSYVDLYYDEPPEEFIEFKSEDCRVIAAPKADPLFKGDLMHVAFINGLLTPKGGVHVDSWDEAIFRPVVNKINGVSTRKKKEGAKKADKKKKTVEKKRPVIDITHVRKYFSLFVIAEVDNPTFTGQNKEYYNSPPVNVKVKPSDIGKLMKWEFVQRIEESIKLKEFASLKDAGKKKRNSLNIPQLEDANNAGDPKLGRECILCTTEGDSAASYVGIGMQYGIENKIGQDNIGIFSLRGKVLNVRNAGITKILKNKEVIGLIKALGLEYGVDYTELKQRNKLRYGKIYVISDSDNDGCLEGKTLINLPAGLSVPISQFTHHPPCISWYEKCDGFMPANVTKFMDKGMKKVVEVLFEDGRKIVLTPDHKLCSTEGEWIEAQHAEGMSFKMDGIFPSLDYEKATCDWKLPVGNMTFTMNSQVEIDRTLAFCRILGVLLSDGHFDTTYTEIYAGCAIDRDSMLNDAQKFIDPKLIKIYAPSLTKGLWMIRFRTRFGNACTSLEGVLSGNRTSQPAALPEFITNIKCPLIVVREFLAGFFGGDGVAPCLTKYKTRCSKQRRYRFTGLGVVQSKEPEHLESLMGMMNQMGGLLQLFGINSSVHRQPRSRIDKSQCVKLFIDPDDYLKFADRIGFRHCIHKMRRLSCVQSYYRLYNMVRNQRQKMAKRGLELRSEGMRITEACETSISEFRAKHTIIHPASLIKEGNIKYSKQRKILKGLCRGGFDDPITFLRKIDGLRYFISEEDIELDTNRQGTAHYGIMQEDAGVAPLKLRALSVKELKSQKHVFDLTVEDPVHCFIAGGIVAHNCHITGLITNFIHSLFPSLLEAGDFLHFLRVPIVKINMKQEQLTFLFYYASQQYLINNKIANFKKAVRYFKGLGTFKPKDIAEDFGRYPVALVMNDNAQELLPKVFGKDDSNFRKEWLIQHQDKIIERKTPDFEVEELPIDTFLNDEMRLYSIESCVRGIPCAIDGFKESTRKTVNTAIDEPLNYNSEEMKVVQLAGAVAKQMGYHHGEQNIPDIIIKLAQSFPGANNIPLLLASGHFGSRQGGGKDLVVGGDAAAGRYIFTKMDMLTRLIFRPEDDEFLPTRIQDGKPVEKEYYMPIIPMVLVNGAMGIGTAHSTTVPQYNPFELMDWIDTWLEKKGEVKSEVKGMTFYETPPLVPFYRGFTGKIEVNGSRVTTYGIIEQTGKNQWTITELPLGRLNVSIKKYRTKLEKMKDEKKIKSFTSQKHDLNKPFFVVTSDPDSFTPNLQNMKLTDTISLTNMVLFNEQGRLIKFGSVEEIMEYYCKRRYDFYKIRMNGMLSALRSELKWVQNKIRFIRMVHEKKLEIRDRDETELDSEMARLKFDRQAKSKRGRPIPIAKDTEDA